MIQGIGISLPPAYLVEAEEANHTWKRLLGPPAEGLPMLRDAGASFIELRTIRPGMPPDTAGHAIAAAAAHGFRVTLHGLLHPVGDSPEQEASFPLWAQAADIGMLQGSGLITVHSRASAEEKEAALFDSTVLALRELLDESTRRKAPFTFALEINRTKAGADPSFTWDGVEALVSAVNDPRLGICWDFGHAQYNHLQGLIEAEPPAAFLQKVVHTHIHDLGPGDRTHWPLGEGRVPVERFCQLLKDVDYGGVLNLEIEPSRYPEDPNVRDRILESLRTLARLAL